MCFDGAVSRKKFHFLLCDFKDHCGTGQVISNSCTAGRNIDVMLPWVLNTILQAPKLAKAILKGTAEFQLSLFLWAQQFR